MQQQIIVQASRIISIKDYVIRAFGEIEGIPIYQSAKNQFEGKFVYIFDIDNGKVKWQINRRLIDFKNLVKMLLTKKNYNCMAAFGMQSQNPSQELFIRLQHFLKRCLQQYTIREQIWEFIQQSGHNYEGVQKYKEINMLKKPGGRFSQYCSRFTSKIGAWKNRYFLIHSQGIIYKDRDNNPREYLIYDFDFRINYGKKFTGYDLGIIINSTQRQLTLKADNIFDFVQFIYYTKFGLLNSQYVTMNKFGSYAPTRTNCNVEFFVDGQEYFYSLAHQMLNATKDIYITGWWVSPEFYLVRPLNEDNQKYRLDRILKQVADRGVNVRILVYHEPKVLEINSAYTKASLEKLSPNIKVIRHPIGVLQLLWSHHQKMVIIDQMIGFLGGLDICYGRFDTTDHQIFVEDIMYPGIDYNNMRKIDICNVEEFDKSNYQRDQPKLAWHDIALQAKGPVIWDMSRHFIQYWNYASFEVEQNEREIIAEQHGIFRKQLEKLQKGIERGIQKFRGFSHSIRNRIWPKQQIEGIYPQKVSSTVVFDNYINTVKDHSETDHSRFAHLHTNIQTNTELLKPQQGSPRFPQILQSVNLKKQYSDILDNLRKTRRQDTHEEVGQPKLKKGQYSRTYSFNNSIAVTGRPSLSSQIKNWTFECQMTRSVGQWSIGCSPSSTQPSIQVAYIQLISQARNFIYIENQFFISSYADPNVIKNQVVHALAVRILRAFQNNEQFRVFVMLPLLPGFAGEVDDPDSKILRLQMYWQYQTISRSKTSLFSQLSAYIPDPSRYIKFIGARTHGRFGPDKQPDTEIIYIHSKLMIVDDQYAILGSANINDRSMRGKRDSQLCMVCKDTDFVEVKINNQITKVGRKIHNLRKKLFEEHFGLASDEQMDPLSDYSWNLISFITRQNTKFYRDVFACYPDDSVHTFEDLNQFRKKKNLSIYEQQRHKVKGHAVEFPLNFLLKQNLSLKRMQKESFLPLQFAT